MITDISPMRSRPTRTGPVSLVTMDHGNIQYSTIQCNTIQYAIQCLAHTRIGPVSPVTMDKQRLYRVVNLNCTVGGGGCVCVCVCVCVRLRTWSEILRMSECQK